MIVLPVAVGVLVVESIFAARGEPGDVVSVPAAGLALLLLWAGVAWALRGWVVLLMTFVPATMIALGAAMVAGTAPGPGAALLLVGLALIGAIISFRLSTPERRWSPGWIPVPPSTGRPWPGGTGLEHPTAGSPGGKPAADAARDGDRGPETPGYGFRPLDPLGVHFLHPVTPPLPPAAGGPEDPSPLQRPSPDWDTSRTDVAARDRLVAVLCRRGGTTGPTLATLEEFFTGNGDPRSIAPGLRGAVPLATFNTVLHRVRDHRQVAELLVQVEPLESGRYPAGEWPVAGSVHLVTTLDADEIDALVTDLRPEPALGPLPADRLAGGAPAPTGSAEFALWWD